MKHLRELHHKSVMVYAAIALLAFYFVNFVLPQ